MVYSLKQLIKYFRLNLIIKGKVIFKLNYISVINIFYLYSFIYTKRRINRIYINNN